MSVVNKKKLQEHIKKCEFLLLVMDYLFTINLDLLGLIAEIQVQIFLWERNERICLGSFHISRTIEHAVSFH